mgnify:CR=1 FL=1
MEIFVLVKDTRYDCDGDIEVRLFKTMDEAKSHFNEVTKSYRQGAIEDEWVISDDTDTSFEAYQDGYEWQNHCYFNISACKL